MSKGRLIYIDEDPDDIVYFMEFSDGHFDLDVIQVKNDADINEILGDVLSSPPDAVVTDFMLNEKVRVAFNGQMLIELIQSRNKHLPCFLLTSHTPDALEATHDARLVQTKAAILGADDYTTLFREQIAKVIKDHKAKFLLAESELAELVAMPVDSLNVDQRQRILELDSYIEEHGFSSSTLPAELKEDKSVELLSRLIAQVDALLNKKGSL